MKVQSVPREVVETMASVEISLWDDAGEMLNQELVRLGYKDQSGADPHTIALNYFNAMLRQVPSRPRRVHLARGLHVPEELQEGFNLLFEKVRNGEDFTGNMSARVWKHNYTDGLLNCWNIHHLHLGVRCYDNNPKLIERTGPVLFARITDTDFYAISIEEHDEKSNPLAFYDQKMIEIMHTEFPQMMRQFKAVGVVGLENTISNSEHKDLRDERINSLLQTKDGTVYMPPGFGITASKEGYGVKVSHQKNVLFQEVRNLQTTILKECEKQDNLFDAHGCSPPYEFKLAVLSQEVSQAVEVSSGLRVMASSIIQNNETKRFLIVTEP
jgi:hypothetical protein